jgi:hypothetical protein
MATQKSPSAPLTSFPRGRRPPLPLPFHLPPLTLCRRPAAGSSGSPVCRSRDGLAHREVVPGGAAPAHVRQPPPRSHAPMRTRTEVRAPPPFIRASRRRSVGGGRISRLISSSSFYCYRFLLIAPSWIALVLGSPPLPQGSAHFLDATCRSTSPGNGRLGAVGSGNNGNADRRGPGSTPASYSGKPLQRQEERGAKFQCILFQMLPHGFRIYTATMHDLPFYHSNFTLLSPAD